MIWTILGIEETKDKKAITRAYREHLSGINPEEKPDEFKELRSAYEQALRSAEQTEKPKEEKTELELWSDELKALYFDLQRRLDIKAWEELLSWDICQSLGTRYRVEEALLSFFTGNYQISHDVMKYLNDQFGFSEHIDELREKYPADFLEYIILGRLHSREAFPFALFEPGMDGKTADAYLELYRRASQTDINEAEPLYEQMRNSSEKHPYGEALLLKAALFKGDDSAVEELCALCEKWPTDDHLALDLMLAYHHTNQMDKLEQLADECLKRTPKMMAARRYKAEASAARGDYRAAVDIVNRMMSDLTGEQHSFYELNALRREWNDAMISQLERELEANPDNAESLYDLLWCYIHNDRQEEAREMVKKLPEEKPDAFGYYNVKSVLASEEKHFEEALDYLHKLLKAVDELRPDGTQKTEERIHRRAEVLSRISTTLFELGRKDEAIEMAEKTLQESDVEIGFLFSLASMQLEAKNYERAEELAERILQKSPGNSSGYYYKAFANFKMGRDNIAFEAVNNAMNQDASNLQFYLLKLRILVRNDAFDGAWELIDLLARNEIVNEPTVEYCKICLFKRQKNENTKREEYDEVLKSAAELDEKLNDGKNGKPDWTEHFYYLYALITADRQDFDQEYPVEPLIDILDKGLAVNPNYYASLNYKGWLLKKDKKTEEALKIFKKLEQEENHDSSVEVNLAELYYGQLKEHAEEALYYYKLLLKNEPENADYYFFAGMCLQRMERPEEAEYYFRMEQKYAPDDIDGYYRLAFVLLKCGRPEEAAEQGKQAVEMAKKREGNTVRFWIPLINAYRRMNKLDEALAAVKECSEHNPDWKYRKTVFDIYLQMGRLKEAHKYANKWNWAIKEHDERGAATALTRVAMQQKKWGKLRRLNSRFRSVTEPAVLSSAKMLRASQKGRWKQYLKIAEKDYLKAVSSHDRANYAWALFVGGKKDKAKEIAAGVLEEMNGETKQATGMRLMYHCRRIRMLALLGREEEAREAAKTAKQIPLCENCEYCACKDLTIYRCCMEFVFGNYERAMELAVQGEKEWPDETDFIELQYLIKAKGT